MTRSVGDVQQRVTSNTSPAHIVSNLIRRIRSISYGSWCNNILCISNVMTDLNSNGFRRWKIVMMGLNNRFKISIDEKNNIYYVRIIGDHWSLHTQEIIRSSTKIRNHREVPTEHYTTHLQKRKPTKLKVWSDEHTGRLLLTGVIYTGKRWKLSFSNVRLVTVGGICGWYITRYWHSQVSRYRSTKLKSN